MAFDTTNFAQGAESVSPDGTSTKYGSCAYSGGCAALNLPAADFTFGAALRSTATSSHYESVFDSEGDATQGGGYFAVIQPLGTSGGNWSCGNCDNTNNTTGCDQIDKQGALGTTSGWGWVACKYTHTGHTMANYIAGTNQGSYIAPVYAPSSGRTFTLASSPNTTGCLGSDGTFANPCQLTGDVDDAWVYAGAMPDASICRICACNVDGKACGPNACSGTSYRACTVDSDCGGPTVTGACDTTSGLCQGRRHTKCGDCTMPASCNQATP